MRSDAVRTVPGEGGEDAVSGREGSRVDAARTRRSCERPTRITRRAPSWRKRWAMARPMPDVPPVIRQVLSERRGVFGVDVKGLHGCTLGMGVYGLREKSDCSDRDAVRRRDMYMWFMMGMIVVVPSGYCLQEVSRCSIKHESYLTDIESWVLL